MLQMVVTLSEMKIQLVVTVLNQIQNGHGSPKIGFQVLFLDIGGVVLTKPKVSRLDTQFYFIRKCIWQLQPFFSNSKCPVPIGRSPRCNFPFQYNESLYFEPVVVDDKKMCSIAKNTKDKEGEYKDYIKEVFKKTFQECSPCTQGESIL